MKLYHYILATMLHKYYVLTINFILVKRELFKFILIMISKLLKRHSKAKRKAPAYSPALREIKG